MSQCQSINGTENQRLFCFTSIMSSDNQIWHVTYLITLTTMISWNNLNNCKNIEKLLSIVCDLISKTEEFPQMSWIKIFQPYGIYLLCYENYMGMCILLWMSPKIKHTLFLFWFVFITDFTKLQYNCLHTRPK